MIVAVVAGSVEEIDHPPRHTCCGSVETIVDAHFQSPHVKIVKVAVECCITIPGLQMSVLFFPEPLSEEISNVSKYYENEIGDVGGKKVVVRWLVHYWLCELSALVSAGVSVRLRIEGPELGVLPCQSPCLRSRRWLEECSRWLVHVGRVRRRCRERYSR